MIPKWSGRRGSPCTASVRVGNADPHLGLPVRGDAHPSPFWSKPAKLRSNTPPKDAGSNLGTVTAAGKSSRLCAPLWVGEVTFSNGFKELGYIDTIFHRIEKPSCMSLQAISGKTSPSALHKRSNLPRLAFTAAHVQFGNYAGQRLSADLPATGAAPTPSQAISF